MATHVKYTTVVDRGVRDDPISELCYPSENIQAQDERMSASGFAVVGLVGLTRGGCGSRHPHPPSCRFADSVSGSYLGGSGVRINSSGRPEIQLDHAAFLQFLLDEIFSISSAVWST